MNPISDSARVYFVPAQKWQGATYIAICPQTGFLGVSGDFLSFTHVFPPEYRSEPFIPFLKGLSRDYLLTKGMGRDWQEIDYSRENRILFEELLRRRRRGDITSSDAAWAFGERHSLNNPLNVDEWYSIVNGDDILSTIQTECEIHPGDSRKPKAVSTMFWEDVWEPFIVSLGSDDGSEAGVDDFGTADKLTV